MKKHHLYITITCIDSVSIFYNSLKYLQFFELFLYRFFHDSQFGTNGTNNPTSSHLNPVYPNISHLIPQKLFLYTYMPNILLKYSFVLLHTILSTTDYVPPKKSETVAKVLLSSFLLTFYPNLLPPILICILK